MHWIQDDLASEAFHAVFASDIDWIKDLHICNQLPVDVILYAIVTHRIQIISHLLQLGYPWLRGFDEYLVGYSAEDLDQITRIRMLNR